MLIVPKYVPCIFLLNVPNQALSILVLALLALRIIL